MKRAARSIVAARLAPLRESAAAVARGDGAEPVHQARVAIRRLRAVLRLFRETIGKARARAWRDALAEVARALGEARDWDVFALETLPAIRGGAPVPRALATRLGKHRAKSRAAAREALASAPFQEALREIAAWSGEDERLPSGERGTLRRFARRALRKRHERLLRRAARLPSLDAAARHRLRIEAKRLRYGAEALAPLYEPESVAAYRSALVALQDELGRAQDAVTGQALLARLAPPEPFAASARARISAQARGDPARLEALVSALARAERFWE